VKKIKIYLDTSVISHLQANDTPEKMQETLELWEHIKAGKYEVFVSDIVLKELRNCIEPKQTELFRAMQGINANILQTNDEVIYLAKCYINNNVLTQKSYDDCLHIALAVISNCDLLVSWNFKHLVNYKTNKGIKIINAINDYKEIFVVSPTMLINE
jgi:predicted nucleic acid-binding protein